jgi:branched-chain amino acid transport system substrate-binding protein
MVSVSHIQAFIAEGSSQINAQKPLAARNKIVLVNPAGSDPTIADPSQYTISNIPSSAQEMAALAKYMVDSGSVRKLAILVDSEAIGRRYADRLKSAIKDSNSSIEVVGTETFDQTTTTNFRAQLLRLAAKSPEAIFTNAIGQQAAAVLNQAKTVDGLSKVQWFENTTFLQSIGQIGAVANGVVCTNITFNAAASARATSFATAYKAKFNADPLLYSATAYDAVYLIAKAIGEVGYDGEKMLKSLTGVTGFDGAMGTLSIGADGQAAIPIAIMKVAAGKPTALTAN